MQKEVIMLMTISIVMLVMSPIISFVFYFFIQPKGLERALKANHRSKRYTPDTCQRKFLHRSHTRMNVFHGVWATTLIILMGAAAFTMEPSTSADAVVENRLCEPIDS